MAASHAESSVSRPGLADLPEDCLAAILLRTTPKDVARLASVSTTLRAAACCDSVWQSMLPPFYADILALAPEDAPASDASKKQVYDYLCRRVLLENGTQDFWLDRETGGVCRSVAARGLFVIWGGDARYWDWTRQEGSRFAEVAYLKQVCWLQVQGSLLCSLPPGAYTLSWRLSILSEFYGFGDKPVKFSLEATDNDPVQFEKVLDTYKRRREGRHRHRQEMLNTNWFEIDVGEFTVESGDAPVQLKFSLVQIEGGQWKSGLCLDSVVIRSTSVRAKEKLSEPLQEGADLTHSAQQEADGTDAAQEDAESLSGSLRPLGLRGNDARRRFPRLPNFMRSMTR